MADFVWLEKGDYAVYFDASSKAEAWSLVQKNRKDWAMAIMKGAKYRAFATVYDRGFDQYPEEWLQTQRDFGRPPVVVKETRKGVLYSRI